MKTILTHAAFSTALQALISQTDFASIGAVKPHQIEDPNDAGKKIDGPDMFLSATVRLPKDTGVTYDGVDLYPNTAQIKLDFFKLAAEPGAVRSSVVKAATISGDALKQRLAARPAIVAVPPAK